MLDASSRVDSGPSRIKEFIANPAVEAFGRTALNIAAVAALYTQPWGILGAAGGLALLKVCEKVGLNPFPNVSDKKLTGGQFLWPLREVAFVLGGGPIQYGVDAARQLVGTDLGTMADGIRNAIDNARQERADFRTHRATIEPALNTFAPAQPTPVAVAA